MGAKQSTLKERGYVIEKETENDAVVTKENERFLIKKIYLDRTPRNQTQALTREIEILKETSHPHVFSFKNSFQEQNIYYVVMDNCQSESLADKIRGMSQPPRESQVLSWIVEITMALRFIHGKGLVHKRLTPENVFISEYGTMRLTGSGKINENKNSNNMPSTTMSNPSGMIYLAPEVFTEGTNDAKSDIWSMGCILYELCTQQSAFSAESSIQLLPKIIGGSYPSLPQQFTVELCELLNNIFSKDPELRPTASEILVCPIMINCLTEKCKMTVEVLQAKLEILRNLADGLERVHQNATIGSLTGGVIGVVGGITSIVGLILSPFTLGASLIVTGVGVGVGVAGGVTAGVSNITNMVNQSTDRKTVQSIIKEFAVKMQAMVIWLQEINNGLNAINSRAYTAARPNTEDSNNRLMTLGSRAGRGLVGIAELVRLAQVINIGKIAAQTSRVVRVAEAATGVLAGLFVAVDVFFIAMDAKELRNIKQAKAAEERGTTVSVTDTTAQDFVSPSDQVALVSSSSMQRVRLNRSERQNQASQNTTEIRSQIMKFVMSIRQAANDLQEVVDELKNITSSIPFLHYHRALDWKHDGALDKSCAPYNLKQEKKQ